MNNNCIKIFFCSLALFMVAACSQQPKEVLGENEYYACSMDPQVLEKQMGMCPICKMPLAKITLDKSQMHIIKLNSEQIRLANIQTDTVRISSIGKESMLTGVFAVNQDLAEQVSARIEGRIEKLYHKVAGEEIRAGEPAYELYSLPLFQAQQEYLAALTQGDNTGGGSMAASSRNKLLLWGLSEGQITELEKTRKAKVSNTIYSPAAGTITEIPFKEGDVVNEGDKIYELADFSVLWVEAQVFSNELHLLTEGKSVVIIPDAFPEEVTEGVIVFSNPRLQANSKINLVRAVVKNPGGKLKPGMQAYVLHRYDEKPAIVLPVDAVIRDKKGSVVWIRNKEGGFESRKVETGIENKYRIEVLSGLSPGDCVVVSGAYLINSEYVFKRGMMPGVVTDSVPSKTAPHH